MRNLANHSKFSISTVCFVSLCSYVLLFLSTFLRRSKGCLELGNRGNRSSSACQTGARGLLAIAIKNLSQMTSSPPRINLSLPWSPELHRKPTVPFTSLSLRFGYVFRFNSSYSPAFYSVSLFPSLSFASFRICVFPHKNLMISPHPLEKKLIKPVSACFFCFDFVQPNLRRRIYVAGAAFGPPLRIYIPFGR